MIAWNILSDALDELTAVRTQIQQARALDRTARFYQLLLAGRTAGVGTRHVGNVIELSGGWCIVHWLHDPKSVAMYTDIRSVQTALCANGMYLLAWQDTSERTPEPGSRASVTREPLTPRDVDMLHLLSRGLTNQAIGSVLGLSTRTVRNRLSILYRKMDIHSRLEAGLLARDRIEEDIPL